MTIAAKTLDLRYLACTDHKHIIKGSKKEALTNHLLVEAIQWQGIGRPGGQTADAGKDVEPPWNAEGFGLPSKWQRSIVKICSKSGEVYPTKIHQTLLQLQHKYLHVQADCTDSQTVPGMPFANVCKVRFLRSGVLPWSAVTQFVVLSQRGELLSGPQPINAHGDG